MAVGFKVKFYWYQIGHGDFLHSFFSSVAYNLENGDWGSDISKDITDLSNYFVTSDGDVHIVKEFQFLSGDMVKQSKCMHWKMIWNQNNRRWFVCGQ